MWRYMASRKQLWHQIFNSLLPDPQALLEQQLMFLEVLDPTTQFSSLRVERVQRLSGALSDRESSGRKAPRSIEVVDIEEVLSEGLAYAEDFVQLESDRADSLHHGATGLFGIHKLEPEVL